MTNANTLKRWRPHPIVFIYCALAILLVGSVCFLGVALRVAQWYQPKAPLWLRSGERRLFVAALWLSLRRCSTPALPAFSRMLLITAYMTIE